MTAPKLRFKEFDGDLCKSDFAKASIKIIDGDRGANYPKSDDFYDKEFCLFLNAGNVTKHGFSFENTQFITKEKDQLLRKGKLAKNDLVITTRGTVGNVAYFDKSISFENMRINSGMVIARCQGNVIVDFINQFLKSDLFEKWLDKNAFGSAQPQLTVKLLNSIKFNYPSKEEQTKIASFLSAVDEKINQLSQKHSLLSQYKQGMMQKLFSQQIRFKADDGSEFGEWEDKKLGDICLHFQSGKTITSASISENGEYPVYGGNGLRGYANTYTHDGIYALIGRQGALCGNINLVTGKNFISEHAIAVQTKKDSSTEWLSRWFDFMQLNRFSESSAQAGLAVNKLVKFDISVPCLEEQTKIANFLSAIDQKIEVVAQQIEQAKTWKKGLLQQMFV